MNTDLFGKLSHLGVALLLTVPALQGCKTDPEADEGGTETAGDGDGDGDMGDGDGDGDGDMGDGDGEPGDGDGDPVECPTFDPIAGAADGDPCTANDSCSSQVCEIFSDVPPPGDGTCQPADDMCRTRIMGTMFDFTTRTPMPDISMKVATAIMAAVDPVGAISQADATSDANGIIDTLSNGALDSPLGIVGLSSGAGYYLTATGLASPAAGTAYGPANAIHDIWAVPEAELTAWSDALMTDPEMMDFLPLGDAGGVVGLVRDATTGDLIEGAVVVSVEPDTTSAKVRYLNAAGDGFTADMTSTQGMFVIVDPGLGERFDVEIGGMSQGLSGTGGSANGAIFTLIMNVAP